MANKKIKRIAAGLMLMACCTGLFSMPALAETGDGGRVSAETAQAEPLADTETGAEVNSGDVGTADTASTESGSTEKKNENALTPDGNMKLVDDIGETTGEGKQFITVQSKSGQTFYIIIDRDQDANSSVYFLNQVDEADLLSLMDEAEVKEYAHEQEEKSTATETTAESTVDPVVTESGEISAESESSAPAETKPEETDWRADLYARLPALSIVAVVLIGLLVFFMKMRKRGGNRDGDIDPDRDYQDGYEWEEEEDDDGIIDFDEEPDDEPEDEEEPEPEPDPFDQKYKYQVYDLQDGSEDE